MFKRRLAREVPSQSVRLMILPKATMPTWLRRWRYRVLRCLLKNVMLLIIFIGTAYSDPIAITGELSAQPITLVQPFNPFNGDPWPIQFFNPGQIIQDQSGRIDLLTRIGWTRVPPEIAWLAKGGQFEGLLGADAITLTQGIYSLSLSLSDTPEVPAQLVITPASLHPVLSAEHLQIDFQGYQIAEGTWKPLAQVTEAWSLAMLGMGLIMLSVLSSKEK